MSDKHIFALYFSKLSLIPDLEIGKTLVLQDLECWHRIINVLHLQEGEECIFFDGEKELDISLLPSSKKGVVVGVITTVKTITPAQPELNLYQGILKREAFNDVIYLAAQMGASSITPLITKKTQRMWGGPKEMDRLQKVMIAACEQAKQFVIPIINEPVEWSKLSLPPRATNAYSLFCQPTGTSLFECLQNIVTNNYQKINVFIGPEGGFTQQEQEMLIQAQIVPCALTKSILRSQEAVAVCIGAIKSVVR